jgi:HAD superfamily hydrolase (TIGR01549 family)
VLNSAAKVSAISTLRSEWIATNSHHHKWNSGEDIIMLRGIIFDIDGTLLDSNDAHAACWVQALAENGHEVPYETVRELIGKGSDHILDDLQVTEGREQIVERRKQLFLDEHLAECMATPGARSLIKELRARGLKLAVATSASSQEVQKLLTQAGVDDLFEVDSDATDADDVDASKPDPDVIVAALDKLGMKASEVLMIGDTPYDIIAAKRAGVRTIAMRTGGWFDAELVGSSAVVDDPRDLLLRLDVLYRVGHDAGIEATAA